MKFLGQGFQKLAAKTGQTHMHCTDKQTVIKIFLFLCYHLRYYCHILLVDVLSIKLRTVQLAMLIWQSLQSCHPAGIMSHTTLAIPDCISPEAAALLHEVK